MKRLAAAGISEHRRALCCVADLLPASFRGVRKRCKKVAGTASARKNVPQQRTSVRVAGGRGKKDGCPAVGSCRQNMTSFPLLFSDRAGSPDSRGRGRRDDAGSGLHSQRRTGRERKLSPPLSLPLSLSLSLEEAQEERHMAVRILTVRLRGDRDDAGAPGFRRSSPCFLLWHVSFGGDTT